MDNLPFTRLDIESIDFVLSDADIIDPTFDSDVIAIINEEGIEILNFNNTELAEPVGTIAVAITTPEEEQNVNIVVKRKLLGMEQWTRNILKRNRTLGEP